MTSTVEPVHDPSVSLMSLDEKVSLKGKLLKQIIWKIKASPVKTSLEDLVQTFLPS